MHRGGRLDAHPGLLQNPTAFIVHANQSINLMSAESKLPDQRRENSIRIFRGKLGRL